MDELSLVQKLVVWALPVLLAVTLHEVAHGWVARRLGDYTAAMLGRLSWNPLRHIDPVGTLLVPGLLFLAGGFIFGWAKPVPVVWENLKHPKRDMALVALAGPLANLCMLLGWLVVIKIAAALGEGLHFFSMPMLHMGFAGVMINSMLMALNLLPLPPLDGSRVVAALLPGPLAWKYQQIEPYGLIVLLVLMMSGLLGKILSPALTLIEAMALSFIGL